MKLISGIFVLCTGILISVIAAYISIFGMTQLFAAQAVTVAIMIGAVELGKVVSATWLKFYWTDRSVAKLHKAYLLVAIITSMLITSLGLFGFLSAAHLEQKAPLAGLDIQSAQFDTRLKQKTAENDRLNQRLTQIDKNVGAFLDKGSASKGLAASNSMKKERDTISKQLDANNSEINDLNDKLAPLKEKSSLVEAKLGPVKYLAQLLGYGNNPEVAVQIVILMIMVPFDPLAVILVLSGMMTLNQWRDERDSKTPIEPEAEVEPEPEAVAEPMREPEPESEPEPVQEPEIVTEPMAATRERDTEDVSHEPAHEPEPVSEEVLDVSDTKDVSEHPVQEEIEPELVEITPIEADKNLLHELHERLENGSSLTNEHLIDMLEAHPSIISDLIAIVKDMETDKQPVRITPTQLTGGTFDR